MRLTALRDITARKKAEAAERVALDMEHLYQLAAEATLVEERERRRFAENLHDGPGQLLYVCQLKLHALVKQLPIALATGPLVRELNGLLGESRGMVRSLTSELSPPMLSDLGLESAILWLAEEMKRSYGLTVTLEDDGSPKSLTETQSTILFRVVRELLVNVSKHAGVDRARVGLSTRNNRLVVTVADEGIGIADWRATLLARQSLGLASVNERLTFLKGTMNILSKLGEGTVVHLEIPLDQQSPLNLTDIL